MTTLLPTLPGSFWQWRPLIGIYKPVTLAPLGSRLRASANNIDWLWVCNTVAPDVCDEVELGAARVVAWIRVLNG